MKIRAKENYRGFKKGECYDYIVKNFTEAPIIILNEGKEEEMMDDELVLYFEFVTDRR